MKLFRDRIQSAYLEENIRRKDEGESRLTKTHLWQAADLTSAAATFWFNGSNAADLDTCEKIAPLLRVSARWLFDGTGSKNISDTGADASEHAPINMIDAKTSAGRGKLVYSDDTKKILMFRRDWLAKNDAKPGNVVAFLVEGDSMVDEHIIDGAVVLVDTTKKEPLSRRIYVLWIDGQLYVKQLVKVDELWYARSRNTIKLATYPDIQINIDDRIVGRAFWCGFGL